MIDQKTLDDLIGIRVKHEVTMPDDSKKEEYGVIVQAWYEDEIQDVDCYISFYGFDKPVGKPSKRPEVLRYSLARMTLLDGDWNPVRMVE